MGAVLHQELRDLWLGGRAMLLTFAFSLLLGAITYLAATSEAMNFLEQREAVNLALQVGVTVGALLALLAAADAISGERERGTLEALLLTPTPRNRLVAGKLLAATSLWIAALVVTVPYVWFLGDGVDAIGDAVLSGLVVGTLLAVTLTGFGIAVSAFAGSNRVSLSASLFTLLALFAPTQLPAGAKQGLAGELFLRINPVTAGEHYIRTIVINDHGVTQDVSWLISPGVAAVAMAALALLVVPRLLTIDGRSA